MELGLIIGLILVVLLVIIVIIMTQINMQRQRKDMKELLYENEQKNKNDLTNVKDNVNRDLMMFQSTLTQALQSNLNQLNENTSKKLMTIEQNVNQNLTYGFNSTHKVFAQVMEQMGKMDVSTKNLQELSGGILSLQKILNDKKTRGVYGEIELYSLLESTMGAHPDRYQRQYHLKSGVICDAILFLSQDEDKICIDSKFPLENYNRVIEEENSEIKVRLQKEFVSDVKKHIKVINEKYIIKDETADFALMFIPAEAIFSYIHTSMQEVVHYSYEQKVYLVSPTTLMAYVTAIKAIYIEQKRGENIAEIRDELKKLALEFERFEKRYSSVQNDFERCFNDMRSLSITANKMMVRFSAIQDVDMEGLKEDKQ